jgi:RNA polymerase sigma-70 factor (ECF subfamily)
MLVTPQRMLDMRQVVEAGTDAPAGGGSVRTDRERAPVEEGERRERFERLYEASYQPILAFALRRAATPEDAADVVAETFLAAWRRLETVPDPPEARLWLYATARRVLANQRRGQQRYQRLAARLRAGRSGGSPIAVAVDDRDTSLVTAAFGRLKAEDREVLALTGWEGLDAAELAKVLGCRPGTARVRLHRARKRFARELAAAGIALP